MKVDLGTRTRKQGWAAAILFLGWALAGCTPYFRADPALRKRSDAQRQSASFVETAGYSREAGSSFGVAAAEAGNNSFPIGFPRAAFLPTGTDDSVTVAGASRRGTRNIDLLKYHATAGTALEPAFGLLGVSMDWPRVFQFEEAFREVLDVVHDPSEGMVYTLSSTSEDRCYLTRHNATSGILDTTFTLFVRDCFATEGRRGLIVLGSTELTLAFVSQNGSQWKLIRYDRATRTRMSSFCSRSGASCIDPLDPGVLQVTHPTLLGANGSVSGTYQLAGAFLDPVTGDLLLGGFGTESVSNRSQAVVAKIAADGSLVSTFGMSGLVTSGCSSPCTALDFRLLGTQAFLAGTVNAMPGVFRLDRPAGDNSDTFTFVSYPSSVGQLNGNASILKLAQQPSNPSKIHGIGWRQDTAGVNAWKPFHLVFDSNTLALDTSVHGGLGYRTVVSPTGPDAITSADHEYPLDFKVVSDGGTGSKVYLLTVLPTTQKDGRFRTFEIDPSSAGLDATRSALHSTANLHTLSERTYPIGHFVDEQGRTTLVSRVVTQGATHPSRDANSFPEKSVYRFDRVLANGTRDGSYNPAPIPIDTSVGDCRGGEEGFAHDPVTHRFFISCMNLSALLVTRANERSLNILAFDASGAPVTTFGTSGKAVINDSAVDPEGTHAGNAGYTLRRLDQSGFVLFPLAVIPAGSRLQGSLGSGPGVAVARTVSDESVSYGLVSVLDASGSRMTTLGSSGNILLSAGRDILSIAFTPNAIGTVTPRGDGLFLGLGYSSDGSASVTLLKDDGVTAWTRNYNLEFTRSLSVYAIAVDPSSGNALIATRDRYVPSDSRGVSSGVIRADDGAPLALQSWNALIPPMAGTWVQAYPQAAFHAGSSSFVLGFNIFDDAASIAGTSDPFNSTMVLPHLAQIGQIGNLLGSAPLTMPYAPNSFIQSLLSGPGGEIQGLFRTPSMNAGSTARTGRIRGGIGL